MKPSMLIIDHFFHIKTKSFNFLFDLFREEFDVVVHFIDPEVPFLIAPSLLEHDYILICQLDFVTPFFIARKKKVIVVQMYDGSAGLPDIHWQYNRQASYINFSMHMHVRALKNECRSTFLRYFPNVEGKKVVEDFSTRRTFFWERLPNSLINAARVAALLDGEIDSIHVHRSSDDRSKPSDDLSKLFQAKVTTSDWFGERGDLEAVLDSCNIFVAPRITEGIGHAFLEAMAKGMLVVANDMPTHNEYIINWRNGILFNESTSRIDLREWNDFAADMGRTARIAVEIGHANWLAQATQLLDYVRQTPRSVMPDHLFFNQFASETMVHYQEGLESYSKKLNDNPFPVHVAGEWSTLQSPADEQPVTVRCSSYGLNFVFGESLHDNLLQSGWSKPETGHVWAIELLSSMMLTCGDLAGRDLRLVVEVRAIVDKKLKVTCSGREIGCATIGTSFKYYVFSESVRLDVSKAPTLCFEVDALDVAAPDLRRFAFMLRSIRLVPNDVVIDSERAVIIPMPSQTALARDDALEY